MVNNMKSDFITIGNVQIVKNEILYITYQNGWATIHFKNGEELRIELNEYTCKMLDKVNGE